MSRSFKNKMVFLLSFSACFIFLGLFAFLRYQGALGTYMRLVGNKHAEVEINEAYEDKGVLIHKNFQTITKNIHIQSNVNLEKTGQYEISYTFENQRIVRYVNVKDTRPPVMTLIQDAHMIVFQNEEYEEPGVEIFDNSKEDLNDRLQIHHRIDPSVIGEYKVHYQVSDRAGNSSEIERIVEVVENPLMMDLHYHYDELDNQRQGWWIKKANDHERKPPTYDQTLMEKYNTYYIGDDEKTLYLTFDEGGKDQTYIKEITDILNNHDVDATYFLTRNYILKEADFMRDLVANGHEIGNHTRTHPDMTQLANVQGSKQFVNELIDTQRAIYEVTKKMPPLIFRFPKGDFSLRSLAMVSDLGYRTYFWSHAYDDYSADVSKEAAYNNLISHLHNGAIYLLHPANKGNYEAMEDFILEARRQGYSFELVSQIKKV